MTQTAPIIEVFSSFQGEGPYAGERHLFVRFQDCELSCRFCDTPLSFVENHSCRVETPPGSGKFVRHANPVSLEVLEDLVANFPERTIALTGGEPLQKAPFLEAWLPRIHSQRRILLETAGVHHQALQRILPWIDIISMDLKLPSSTGMGPLWEEHEAFLKTAQRGGKDLYVKIVMTADTSDQDLDQATQLIREFTPRVPVILQPASATAKFSALPSPEQLREWYNQVLPHLPQVRVLPQIHKQMGVR